MQFLIHIFKKITLKIEIKNLYFTKQENKYKIVDLFIKKHKLISRIKKKNL